MSTAPQTTPAPDIPLIDAVADQSAEGVDDLLKGDQRMAGAEGPAQEHPEAVRSLAGLAGLVPGVAWSTAHAIAAVGPFLRKLVRPLIVAALRRFAAELHRLVVGPLDAELRSIAANHPDVDLSRCRAALGKFHDAAPDVPRPAPAPAPAPPQPAAPAAPSPEAVPTAPGGVV